MNSGFYLLVSSSLGSPTISDSHTSNIQNPAIWDIEYSIWE